MQVLKSDMMSSPVGNAPLPPARALPLTEGVGDPIGRDAGVDESIIRGLVDTFYGSIRDDELLGPIFTGHVADWSIHLPKMYAFWSAVVLKTGGYAGRPLEAHQRLGMIRPEHFERWLVLWEAAVQRVVPAGARQSFTVPARRMAAAMGSVLFRGAT
jgi:hemoglobin